MTTSPAEEVRNSLMPARNRRVVVGLDGSRSSAAALRWAVARGGEEGAETLVDVVYAWQPLRGSPIATEVDDGLERARSFVVKATEDAMRASSPVPGVDVRPRAEEGNATRVLLTAATGADLLVIGNKGHSLAADVVIGSVGIRCAARADCPVVLVPDPHR